MIPPHLAPAHEREDDRQENPGALRARLHDAAQALRTPGDWAACLRLAARLPGEDFANILLIHAQRPGATQVRDYRHWTAAGRRVRRGENGIAVFSVPPPAPGRAPHASEDDERGPAWRDADRVTYLWDLSQTTGPPLGGGALLPPRDRPAQVRDALCWLARRLGTRSRQNTARRLTVPSSGASAASASPRASAMNRRCGHWRISSATCCCTTTPATRPRPGRPPPAAPGCAKPSRLDRLTVCSRHGITPAGGLPTRPARPAPSPRPACPRPSWPPGTGSPQRPPAHRPRRWRPARRRPRPSLAATPAAQATPLSAASTRPPARGKRPGRPARRRPQPRPDRTSAVS